MHHDEQPPADPAAPECQRTVFLEALLHDQERGRLGPVEDYVARFPDIAGFVQTEYLAFSTPDEPRTAIDATLPEDCGRYRFTRRLGEGGMGIVHEAVDTELHRRIVIKTLRSDLALSSQARERLRREARVLGRLDHQHLAKVIDLLEVDGRMHLVMPFRDGSPLAQHIQQARTGSEPALNGGPRWPALGGARAERTSLKQIVTFFIRCATALQSAHRAGVVHRDLKPQNLMVAPDGSPVVLDFGLALPESDERLTQVGELMGTPLYMAPEQIEGEKADARTDVYALGVTMYETLTLVHPYAGQGGRAAVFPRILAGDPVPLRRHQPLVPRDLEAVVLRAMDRQPKRRYQDMDAFARDLQRVLDLAPTEARPVSGVNMAWRKVRRRPFVSVLVVVTSVALGLAAWNQVRVSDMKGFAAEQLATERDPSLTSDEKVGLMASSAERLLRRSSSGSRWLSLVYPRGLVISAQHFDWIGASTRDTLRPHVLLRYVYLVEVFDGVDRVGAWSCPSSDTALCTTEPPTRLALAPGRTCSWRISLEGYEAIGEPGCDATQLSDCQSITVDELRKCMPPVTTEFRIAATPVAAMQADFGTPEMRVRSLLEEHFAADALMLLEADARTSTSAILPRRHNELVMEAAHLLDDTVLETAAKAAIEREGERR